MSSTTTPDLDRTRALLEAELAVWRDAVAAREAMLATMQEGIVLVGAEGVRYANPASEVLLGGRVGPIDGLQPQGLRDAVREVQDGAPRAELTFASGGRTIEAVVTETGPPRCALVVARDVTAARQADLLRRNFVANASHELKTPVASIVGLAAALERAGDDPEATYRFVGMLGREVERLSDLVCDLLDLSRLENDAGPHEPVRVDGILLEQCEKLRGDADRAGLRMQVAEPAAVRVMGRANDLARMVHNLLANAIRYTPAGGSVCVALGVEAGHVTIVVADSGVGIPPADLDRVFERFYRVDAARDRETGGTGLGLAIVRHVAETHGGDVAVRSTLGRGSTFTVRLPIGAAGEEL